MIAILNRVVDLVEQSLDEDVDIAALARSLGTTEYHVRRMFSSLAGMPLSEYVRRRRMTVAAADLVGDGWPDQVVVGFPGKPAVWRENPRGAGGPWREHLLGESACNESPAFVDLLGMGTPVLVCGFDETWMGWHEPGPDPRAPFRRFALSAPSAPGTTGRSSCGPTTSRHTTATRPSLTTPSRSPATTARRRSSSRRPGQAA